MTAGIAAFTLVVSGSLAASLVVKATILTVMALMGARFARRSRAATRHVVLAAAFAMLVALPVASLVVPAIRVAVPVTVQGASTASTPEIVADRAASTSGPSDDSHVTTLTGRSFTPSPAVLLVGAWAVGAMVFLLPVAVGLWQVRSIRRSGLPWRHGQDVVDQLAREGNINRRVEVLLHESVPGPMTCGLMRPVVVLPIDAQAWTDEDLVRAIVHELEHVRRADWASQCVARIACAGYWFHPLVWIARRQLALEAERACDDAVLLSTSRHPGAAKAGESAAYADQLVGLAERLSITKHQPLLAMANRSDLAARVRAVLDVRQPRGRAGTAGVVAACATAVMLLAVVSPLRVVAAQSSGPKPKYGAASIKPCEAEEKPTGARGTAGGTNATFSPGRFFVPCVTTEQLIYLAYASYGARDDERLANDDPGTASSSTKIRGGPAWVHSLRDKYMIEATAEGATERTVLMGSMLQSLLEDRFHLQIHRDTEEVSLLTLTVGKSGLKLKAMKDGDCDPTATPGIDPNAGTPKCGNLMMSGGETTRWTFAGFRLSSLASQLSRTLGVHVIDKTGVNDEFVFRFEFRRGQDDFETEAAIFAAVEELGLKLEKTKGPRGFIVIDHIERPTPDFAAGATSSGRPIATPPARAMGPAPVAVRQD